MIGLIAETFHRLPYEIDALPFSEYRRCRNYVLAKYAKDEDSTDTWGEKSVADAPWSAEQVRGDFR